MRFCGGCGNPLKNACPACGAENPAGFRFCGQCATLLDGAPRTERSFHAAEPAAEAERRQVTVLFCDLVGSTQLSDKLDPEDLREIVREYQRVAGEVIATYEGHVAQYLGDGLLIYFGYPHAHEDDARRAVSAGLEIIAAVRGLSGRSTVNTPLSVRIGIHTGFGVAGDVGGPGRREQLVIGRTPNIAARLEGLAAPDTLVISEATKRLVEGFFVLESMGLQSLKGIEAPIEVLCVRAESGARERFEAMRQQELGPLVGRQTELGAMLERVERSRHGRGQVLLLIAEPGLGKSRLVHTLTQAVHGEFQTVIGRCLPHAQTSALLPVMALMQTLLGFERTAPHAQNLEKLRALLAHEVPADPLAVPLLAAFFGLPPPADPGPATLTPHRQREHTRYLLIHLLVAQARKQPLVLVFEDLHWADPSTLEFIDELIEAASHEPILTLLTSRPWFQVPWKHRPYLTSLGLFRVNDEEASRLIHGLAGGRSLPEPVVRQLVDKADGVPLFIEELTRATLESGALTARADRYELTRPLESLSIPDTLRDSLMARLDRLGSVKEVAQLAAAIGRRFSYALLAEIASLEPLFLRRRLDQLVEAGLVLREEATDRLEGYKFKHALIQEAAYESILKSRRRAMHERIARALEAHFPEVVEERPELLARHHEEAGQPEKAARALHRAGLRAMERAAYAEAITSFTHAIERVSTLSEHALRDRLELELRTSMGGALGVTRGYTSPEFEQNSLRARELCVRLGAPPELVPVLFNLWVASLIGSRKEPTQEYARQLLDAARLHPGPITEVPAFSAHGTTLFYLGRFEEARTELHRALRRYSPELHPVLARIYGDDHGLFTQVFLAWLHLLTGDVTQARAVMSDVFALAEHLREPLAQVIALAYASSLSFLLREPEKVREYAERARALCLEQGYPYWLAQTLEWIGWSRAIQGEVAEGLQQLHEGMALFTTLRQKLPLSYYLALLAEVYLHSGDTARGLSHVEQGLGCAETNLDRFYLPELCRLKGELLRAAGEPPAEVRAWFELALTEARASGAALLELRAARSLSVPLEEQGDRERARSLLATALEKVRGGEDLRDSREARERLAQLGA